MFNDLGIDSPQAKLHGLLTIIMWLVTSRVLNQIVDAIHQVICNDH